MRAVQASPASRRKFPEQLAWRRLATGSPSRLVCTVILLRPPLQRIQRACERCARSPARYPIKSRTHAPGDLAPSVVAGRSSSGREQHSKSTSEYGKSCLRPYPPTATRRNRLRHRTFMPDLGARSDRSACAWSSTETEPLRVS